MQFAVWILERSVDLMPPGIEQLALLINFDHRSRNPTSIANAKLMLYILQVSPGPPSCSFSTAC